MPLAHQLLHIKDYSRRLVRAVGYHSLATVEFLVTPDGTPYLIEVNTRLQVDVYKRQ